MKQQKIVNLILGGTVSSKYRQLASGQLTDSAALLLLNKGFNTQSKSFAGLAGLQPSQECNDRLTCWKSILHFFLMGRVCRPQKFKVCLLSFSPDKSV